MEAKQTFEVSVTLQQSSRNNIPDDLTLQQRRCEKEYLAIQYSSLFFSKTHFADNE